MNHDLSYLRSEYARERMIEEYQMEEKKRIAARVAKEAQDEQVSDESRHGVGVVGERDV